MGNSERRSFDQYAEPFNSWLSPEQLERLFWEMSGQIRSDHGAFIERQPKGIAKKLVNEVLPIIFLAKNALVHPKRWDQSLEIKMNIENQELEGSNFDASYRWRSFQFSKEVSGERHIEVTRCVLDGNQSALADEYFFSNDVRERLYADSSGKPLAFGNARFERDSQGKVAIQSPGGGEDLDAHVAETRKCIIRATREKSQKNYPKETTLVLWLFEEANPRATPTLRFDSDLIAEVKNIAKDRFESVFLVGLATAGTWILGNGLNG